MLICQSQTFKNVESNDGSTAYRVKLKMNTLYVRFFFVQRYVEQLLRLFTLSDRTAVSLISPGSVSLEICSSAWKTNLNLHGVRQKTWKYKKKTNKTKTQTNKLFFPLTLVFSCLIPAATPGCVSSSHSWASFALKFWLKLFVFLLENFFRCL